MACSCFTAVLQQATGCCALLVGMHLCADKRWMAHLLTCLLLRHLSYCMRAAKIRPKGAERAWALGVQSVLPMLKGFLHRAAGAASCPSCCHRPSMRP